MRINVEGWEIAVFRQGAQAQAIRLGHAGLAAQRAMPDRLVRAIETATGCSVRPGTLRGDSAVVTADLDCPRG